MNKKMVAAMTAVALVSGAFTSSAFAAREAGDFIFRVGMTNLDPQEKASSDLGGVYVTDDTAVSLTFAYMITPSLAVELLASTPFEHNFSALDGDATGSTQLLPPTVNLQWHFNPAGEFHPYVGAGINYTTFFSTKSNVPDLAIDDAWGYDIQAGVDLEISETLLVNFDVRLFSLEPDLTIGGDKATVLELNPMTVGINVGWKF
jgi:outer membrane protein